MLKERSLFWSDNPVMWCIAFLLWLFRKVIETVLEEILENILNKIKELIMSRIEKIIESLTMDIVGAVGAMAGVPL